MSEETVETQETSWVESVDWSAAEGYEPSDKIKEFKSPALLAKSYDELRKDNSSKIRIPGESANEDEKKAFKSSLMEHMGIKVPESPDGYSFKAGEDMEQYFPDLADQMKMFHEAGLSDDAVSLVMTKQSEAIKTMLEGMKDKQAEIAKESEAALKEKWGNEYDDRLASVNKLKDRFPDAIGDLSVVGLANSQHVLEMLDEVARSISEDAPIGSGKETLQSVEEQLAALKAKPGYMNGRAQDHQEIMKQVYQLQRKRLQKT